MKKNTFKFVALFFALSFLGLSSCKKIDADAIKVDIANVYSTPISVIFQNANPSSPNQITDIVGSFSVSITGPGAQFIVASDGSRVFKSSHGFLTLALVSAAAPSASNPITFNISAKPNDNFASVTQTITITDTMPIPNIVVNVVDYNGPVNGTSSFLSLDTTLKNGVVSTEIVLNPKVKSDSITENATITIPAGTQVLDANKNVINTKSILTTAIQYGTGTEASLGAFPGGFNASSVKDKNGITTSGTFVTAGLIQVEMRADDGTPIKNFSKPISLKVEINQNLTNPTTGNSIKAGETIPVWSLNEGTGEWQYEGLDTIVSNNGVLSATISAKHLSTWNLDFFYTPISNSQLKVNFHIPNSKATITDRWPELLTNNHQYLSGLYTNSSWSQGAAIYDGYTATLSPVPNINNATFVVDKIRQDYTSSDAIVTPAHFNPATVGSIDVTIPSPPSDNNSYINLKLNMWAHCSNKNTNINVGTWVYFYPYSANGRYNYSDLKYCYIATNGGSYNNPVKLKANTKYVCGTWYGGSWNANTIMVSPNDFTFPTTLIPGSAAGDVYISGGGKYTSSNSTLTVDCTFQVNCK